MEHNHNDNHEHEEMDPGIMYEQQWVKDLVQKLQQEIVVLANKGWLGLDDSKSQRVLDYACGHGTISLALLEAFPSATFQGLDSHPAQVQRFNDEAQKALEPGSSQSRMWAKVGDLSTSPAKDFETEEWFDFDAIIMSMALHHVKDPLQMLRQLKKRLRRGGTLVIIEFHGAEHRKHDHYGRQDSGNDEMEMIYAPGGQKIWPGLNKSWLDQALADAGFDKASIDIVPGPTFTIPEELSQHSHGGEKQLVFAKAVA
ncbi:uncharacterized protein LTR77_001262 [Saxophila tyrrhenica]|uniref:Methyltransferase domain-containing protein n=1 Tax=Saxophila tyrrhenica TaxID=1690608 RepID=A0AAV9PLL9_9PEZI|nr:hypothetical protein LTR77_001262 [Saxophila tyrrhenica]